MNSWPLTPSRRGRRQEPHQVDDVLGRQRVDLALGQLRCLAEHVGRHRGAGPRGDGVGAHAVALERTRRRQRQRGDARLGGAVVGLADGTGQPGLRRRVDDAAVDRAVACPWPWPASRWRRCGSTGSGRAGAPAMTASQSSSDMLNSMRSRVMPALLTTMLSPPRPSAVATSSSAVDRCADVTRDGDGLGPGGGDLVEDIGFVQRARRCR